VRGIVAVSPAVTALSRLSALSQVSLGVHPERAGVTSHLSVTTQRVRFVPFSMGLMQHLMSLDTGRPEDRL
jgi:hypothetical protein